MSSEFNGKIVLIAGGTGGLGRAVSLAFLEQGAQVAVTFRHENELRTLKDAASNLSSSLSGFNVDVTDTRQTADLIGTGVRANSVLPSIIDTEANRKAMPNADFAKWPKPEDIAEVVLFLSSDRSRVIHGASIPVFGNGGIRSSRAAHRAPAPAPLQPSAIAQNRKARRSSPGLNRPRLWVYAFVEVESPWNSNIDADCRSCPLRHQFFHRQNFLWH
ncbi:MAG: SDR family oxidoreductase [Terracidiphilus sp.]